MQKNMQKKMTIHMSITMSDKKNPLPILAMDFSYLHYFDFTSLQSSL